MLKSLSVANFALIENTFVEFVPGLNILTGETGAGKSILIDALSAIIGSRSSTDSIRSGADHYRIEAVFDIADNGYIENILDGLGITADEDGTMIIARRLTRHGKNSIHINGCQVTLATLRKIGEKLADMHGQHENQVLLKPEVHLALIDAFSPPIRTKLDEYRHVYKMWQDVQNELTLLAQNARERIQREEMLAWQTQEIAAAALTVGEDEKLERDVRVMANSEKIINAVNRSYILLNQGNKGFSGIVSCLSDIKRELELAARYDTAIEPQLTIVTETLYQLEEAAAELRDYRDNIDFNPARLAKFEDRLDVIYKLKKKYGITIADILKYHDQAVEELAAITNYEQRLSQLEHDYAQLKANMAELAGELDAIRRQTALQMAKQISGHMADLGMPKARFIVDVKSTGQFTLSGANEVVFLFSANLGEDPKPLHKIASGGELSRIALAIKTVCADEEAGIMVFDEIDAGIGGQTAQMVAEKIARIAVSAKQILCITHLPQIACMADCHIYIEKLVQDDRTNTQVKILNTSERLTELARMGSGCITQLSLDNAAQMLELAQGKKENWKNQA